MEQENIINSILELIERPAFCVRDKKIVQVNQAARQRLISIDTELSDLLGDNIAAYTGFENGTLSLGGSVQGVCCNVQVTRTAGYDIFVLDFPGAEMQSIALAAQNLRGPLNIVMTIADLLPCESSDQAAQLQRGLSQLHRIVCNMSDSYRYQQNNAARMETVNLTSVFDEYMEAIGTHLDSCAVKLLYTGLEDPLWSLADREMLGRGVYNLISNAVKFMKAGSTLCVKVTQTGKQVHFSVQSATESFHTASAFRRYLRQPGIEDCRHGIGLGMPLVRSIAAAHGGTVLIDHPDEDTTRITMTISITNAPENIVRSSIRLPVSNYAGDRDLGLMELSEILPADAYQNMD